MDESAFEKRKFTLKRHEFLYSLGLQLRFNWLWERSNSLDETISRVVLPVYGAKRLFSKLIRKFKYVDHSHSQKNVIAIAHQIKVVWKCSPKTTLIMPVCSRSQRSPDGSSKMVYDLRSALGNWNGVMFTSCLDLKDPNLSSGCDVILCDDFIGSGSTIMRKMSKIQAAISPGSKLYVVSLAAMKNARDTVLNKPDIFFYTPLLLEKGINDSSDESIMLNMEALLAPRYNNESLENCSLGYAKTGSLYFNEDYRIPNNVYPIFWWGKMNDGQLFRSLFMRP